MIRHIVLFRRKVGVPPNAGEEEALVKRMQALGSQIPVVRQWRVAENEVSRPVCWHYVLESQFENLQALDDYLVHPIHQELIADLKPYFEWAAVDYTI